VRDSFDRLSAGAGALLVAVAGVALAAVVYLTAGTGDYAIHGRVAGDNAGPAMNALVHGHLATLARLQPLMGLTSLVWRLPFAALGELLGGGERGVYRLGCLACLLPAMALVAWLVRRRSDSAQLGAVALASLAIVAGPATRQAVAIGHPEELLAIVLATGAVLCAAGERQGSAAVLLGLAIGTKQWALLAAPSVLLAHPAGRARLALTAIAVAAATCVVLPLASPGGFAHAGTGVGAISFSDPFSLWWPFGSALPGGAIARALPLGIARSQAAALALVLALALVWLYGRRVRGTATGRVDPLVLLALLGLLRCLTDPDPLTYNFVALVIPLAVWEAGGLRRLPIATGLMCAVLALLPTGQNAFRAGLGVLPPMLLSILWIGVMLAFAVYLTRAALPQRARAGASRAPSRSSSASVSP
jgi:hypothetical protein